MGALGKGETAEEKQVLLFCCLKLISWLTLAAKAGKGQYCLGSCWGTLEGNADGRTTGTGVVVSRCEQDGGSRMVGAVGVSSGCEELHTAAGPSSLPSGLALNNVYKDCESHIQSLFQQEGAGGERWLVRMCKSFKRQNILSFVTPFYGPV